MPSASSHTFGSRLARLRERRYLSQRALASRSGLGRGTIGGLEQGVRPDPRLSTLLRLARGLDIPVGELSGISTSQTARMTILRPSRPELLWPDRFGPG